MLKYSTKYIQHNSSELTMLAEGPGKHIPGPPPLASGVCHDACLLGAKKAKIKLEKLFLGKKFSITSQTLRLITNYNTRENL